MLRRSRVRAAGNVPSAKTTAIVWRGKTLPHTRQDRQASSVSRPLEGRQRRKSPVRRCFKSRPPFGGVRRFASGCRSFLAVNRPLVRIPANRHATTGTCEIGQGPTYANRPALQELFLGYAERGPRRAPVLRKRPTRSGGVTSHASALRQP